MSAEEPVPEASTSAHDASTPTELKRHQPTIAFDKTSDQPEIEEKSPAPLRVRNRNLEVHRELTQEDKELSRANYDHLERQKSQPGGEKGDGDGNLSNQTDIREHMYSADHLGETLETTFDLKAPASSFGLTMEEAAARLSRNGPNVLTPPKKKSALQKASIDYDIVLTSVIHIVLAMSLGCSLSSSSTVFELCSTCYSSLPAFSNIFSSALISRCVKRLKLVFS